MTAAFVNGHLIEAILGLVVLEAVALACLRRWTNQGSPVAAVILTLLSGAFLLLALRAALDDGSREVIAFWLLAALLAHAADLYGRWRV